MFTGIVSGIGILLTRESRGADLRCRFELAGLTARAPALGDSIAINGCCLTVAASTGDSFDADVSAETLRLTNLGKLHSGDQVNWELALRAGDALGGHWVTGHIDGQAEVVGVEPRADSLWVRLEVPFDLARYVARKGSVALDGVSLTVNDVAGVEFAVNLIPHTRRVTTLGALRVGRKVNFEADLVARYLDRLLEARGEGAAL
jgi:riboflavin synthase